MNKFVLTTILVSTLALASTASGKSLPEIRSAQDAVMQLRMKNEKTKLLAIKNLQKACTGRYRRTVKDSQPILKLLSADSRSGSDKVKKAIIESYRCFSPQNFQALLTIQLADKQPEIANFAAEISARVSDPAMVKPLLHSWKKLGKLCLQKGLSKAQIDSCVWLTYAPGASVERASADLKEETLTLAAMHIESPYAKVREVAVETITAAGSAEHAKLVSQLIEKERAGHFADSNDKALLTRFKKRVKTLKARK